MTLGSRLVTFAYYRHLQAQKLSIINGVEVSRFSGTLSYSFLE